MTELTLSDLWENVCRRPRHAFMSLPGRTFTYGDLAREVRAELGRFDACALTPGSRVLIVLSDECQAVASFLAAVLDGLTAVMLAPDTPEPRVSAVCDAVGPGIVRRDGDPIGSVASRVPRLPADGRGAAYVLFTSGTTQLPSGVVITRHNLLAHLATLVRLFACGPESRIFNDMVLAHADGLVQGPFLAMACGGTVLRAGGFSLPGMEQWLARVGEGRATHVITVPTVWSMIDRYAERDDYFTGPECQYLMSVAARLDTDLWTRLEKRFSRSLYNEYGLTETVASGLYAGPHAEMGPVGTIGKPIDCEAAIVGNDGELAPPGQSGELLLRGPNVFTGYWNNSERTAGSFTRDGWFRTGDVVRKRPDGAYEILGRVKTIIMMAGFLIRPEEIDEAMISHSAVAQSVTVGLPHEEFGEIPVTAVVLDEPVSEAALTAHARHGLEPLKVPKRIIAVDRIPRGISGKPDLGGLRQQLEQAIVTTPGAAAEVPDMEMNLLDLAARVFRVEPSALSLSSAPGSVSGWDSFSHVTLILALETHFGVELDTAKAMSMKSLGELRDAIVGAAFQR